MHRLFVALRAPEEVRNLLLDAMDGVPGLHWLDDDQLHLTLRFMGEVERPMAEDRIGLNPRFPLISPEAPIARAKNPDWLSPDRRESWPTRTGNA